MHTALRSWAGIGVCIGVAALLCVFLSESTDTRFVAPAVCLQAVILASLCFGRLSGLIGSVASSLILTFFLFPPIGSIAIHDPTERTMLFLFQFASIGVAWMAPGVRMRESNRFLR